jgi:hypothetical protein
MIYYSIYLYTQLHTRFRFTPDFHVVINRLIGSELHGHMNSISINLVSVDFMGCTTV